MKHVLITGENSYVGNSFAAWVNEDPKISIEKMSLRDGTWRERDFSEFDAVLHVAGIAHQKETKENEYLYYQVNRDLAIEVAEKAKNDGVNHFVFLSSMSVYGLETGVINESTPLKPKTNYGISKLEAEKGLADLTCSTFNIAILRPPMIYGADCKGNYPKLAKLAIKSPFFPDIENKRSMIFIDTLSEFIKRLINYSEVGLYFPQNADYVKTSEMVKIIAEVHGKKLSLIKLFNPFIKLFQIQTVNKVFGDLVYDKNLSGHVRDYNIVDFRTSIELTENVENNL
ncbi:NAD-dependent epimerase/dehydratase family protein [Oceanobacillus sp. FSL W7-1293]|uniref:NAD-dependent epimerase/dehydratase family protein n=1 Tax=Oceanobacillus sp. FSL W7-1293 TaxID=2921699 RepID=UPI0030D3DDBE